MVWGQARILFIFIPMCFIMSLYIKYNKYVALKKVVKQRKHWKCGHA